MSKVCARWVPRLLRDHEKETRVRLSQGFIDRYEREGNAFLHRVITMDETWLYLYEPESKQQSMVWKHPQSPPPKKAKTCRSAGKFMFLFFMDVDGMILQHAVPQGTTVNAEYYRKVGVYGQFSSLLSYNLVFISYKVVKGFLVVNFFITCYF